jgi:hypothetical protein
VYSMTHEATSKVENSAQGSSCKLKFVHGGSVLGTDVATSSSSTISPKADQLWCLKLWRNCPCLLVQVMQRMHI